MLCIGNLSAEIEVCILNRFKVQNEIHCSVDVAQYCGSKTWDKEIPGKGY